MKTAKEIADELENLLSDPDKVLDADGDIAGSTLLQYDVANQIQHDEKGIK